MPELLLVAGERCDAVEGATFDTIDPATAASSGAVAKAGVADVDAALPATRAFDDGPWRRMSATDRGRVLARVADLLRERSEQFAVAESRSAGHPIGDARWEVGAAAATFEFYAGAANKHHGSVVPVQDDGLDVVLREPVGPCALIVPWNFPLMIACWKVAPALAAGNPIILKPASLTPHTALLLGDLLVEAGVPPECVNVLPGRAASSATRSSPTRVAKVSFTGETTTGAVDPQGLGRQHHPRVARARRQVGLRGVRRRRRRAAPPPTPRWPCSATPARTAAARRILVERSAYDDFVAAFVAGAPTASPSARRSMRPPRSGRSSPPASGRPRSTTSASAPTRAPAS